MIHAIHLTNSVLFQAASFLHKAKDMSLKEKIKPQQLSLFDDIALIYANRGEVNNNVLYKQFAALNQISQEELNKLEPIGEDGRMYSKKKREIRWYQQELKQLGLLERVESKRGVWRLTEAGKSKVALHQINNSFQMLAFSTKLGIALWGDARKIFEKSTEPIHLILSSPPYPLQFPRAYGNVQEKEYADWLCYMIEPIVKNLVDGGSVVLNISNDISIKGSPHKSLYKERLVLALYDRLGLYKMDEIPWINTSKIPSNAWATQKKVQMLPAWEPILWLCNNPAKTLADTRKILKPHTKEYLKYIAQGGSQKEYSNGDGSYKIKKGAFSNQTNGTLPKNIFQRGHRSASTNTYHEVCKRLNIPKHGATFPIELPRYFIEFLTQKGNTIADPFGGRGTTLLAAEELERNWIGCDITWEYLRGGGECFCDVVFEKLFLEAV